MVVPMCETVNIPRGSELFTDQTALKYTLMDVWRPSDGSAGAGAAISPSLSYYNDVSESSNVSSVEINYVAMNRTASPFAFSEWGAVIRTYATCSIYNGNRTFFNITQVYDYVPLNLSFSWLYTPVLMDYLSRNPVN